MPKKHISSLVENLARNPVMDQIDSAVDEPLSKLPKLPKGFRDFIVSIAPWVVLIAGLVELFGSLQFFLGSKRFLSFLESFMPAVNSNYLTVLHVFAIIFGILYLLAFTPLKARKMVGWRLLLLTFWLSIIESLVSLLVFGAGGVFGVILSLLIGLYILYQIKPVYK